MKIYYNDGSGERELLNPSVSPAATTTTTTTTTAVKEIKPKPTPSSVLSTKKYLIVVEESINSNLEIEAESAEDALEIALERYRNGEFIADEVEIYDVQMIATSEDGEEETEWINVLA